MTFKQKAISGIAWNTAGKISQQILHFVMSVILMRLLLPSDYGLLAMAMVLIGFAALFSDFGFSSALIQNQNIDESHKSSIFWVNIIVGLMLTGFFFLFSDIIAKFYDSENLTRVIRYLSFFFIISALSIVPATLLQKEMRYDAINKINVSAVIFSGLIGIYLAFTGWGVMSLVFQNLSNQAFKIPLLFVASRWWPKLILKKNSVKQLFSYGAYLTGFNFINYWARRLDNLLIGKFMGASSLGIYSRAYNLMLLPLTQMISVVSNVMFPALSSIQTDKERVKRIFLNVVETLAFVTFPMMMGLIAAADSFVLAIFGAKWAEVIPIIRILAFVGITQTLASPTGWIYTSQGKTDWMFWWGVFGSGSIIMAIIIGVLIGSIHSVAIAYLIINVILAYPVIAIPGRLINLKFIDVLSRVFPILIVSSVMSILVYYSGAFLLGSLAVGVRLLFQVIIGAAIYYGIMSYFKNESYLKIKVLFVEQVNFYKNKFANSRL